MSELLKPTPHPAVVQWVSDAGDEDLHLSAVTLGVIQADIEMAREQGRAKVEEIEACADQVALDFHALPMDATVFRLWAQLMHCRSDTL